jgi:hypothetical protein
MPLEKLNIITRRGLSPALSISLVDKHVSQLSKESVGDLLSSLQDSNVPLMIKNKIASNLYQVVMRGALNPREGVNILVSLLSSYSSPSSATPTSLFTLIDTSIQVIAKLSFNLTTDDYDLVNNVHPLIVAMKYHPSFYNSVVASLSLCFSKPLIFPVGGCSHVSRFIRY